MLPFLRPKSQQMKNPGKDRQWHNQPKLQQM